MATSTATGAAEVRHCSGRWCPKVWTLSYPSYPQSCSSMQNCEQEYDRKCPHLAEERPKDRKGAMWAGVSRTQEGGVSAYRGCSHIATTRPLIRMSFPILICRICHVPPVMNQKTCLSFKRCLREGRAYGQTPVHSLTKWRMTMGTKNIVACIVSDAISQNNTEPRQYLSCL